MHRGTSARHRDVKLRFVRLAKSPNRHADNDLVDRLGLASVTGDSYSLIDMQSSAVANKQVSQGAARPVKSAITTSRNCKMQPTSLSALFDEDPL